MRYLLFFFSLILLTGCDPCECDDCCVDTTRIHWLNAGTEDLTLVFYSQRSIEQFGIPTEVPFTDYNFVPVGETSILFVFTAPQSGGSLTVPPFELGANTTTYDSAQIIIDEQVVAHFTPEDCTNNPLCESTYVRSEQELDNRTVITYLYTYE